MAAAQTVRALAPVMLVVGEQSLLVDREVAAIEAAVLPSAGLPAFNVETVRLSEGDGLQALATARTPPMMADRRLVVVRDLQAGTTPFFEALTDYVGAFQDGAGSAHASTVLVLAGRKFPAVVKGGRNWSAKLKPRIAALGGVIDLPARVDPARFASARAQELGGALTPDAARLLAELVGEDLARVSAEVDKVVLSVPEGTTADADAVAAVCSVIAGVEVWALASAVAAADADAALAALHRLLEDGSDERQLAGLLAWKVRTLLRGGELLRAGSSDVAVMKATRLRKDEVAGLRARRARLGAADTLGGMARAWAAMHRVRAGDRRVLEGLVLDLCR